MSKTAQELFREGHRKLVCIDDNGLPWWKIGKAYSFKENGNIIDEYGHDWKYPTATFEPYSFFGMRNKEFTPEYLDAIASAVAEKVCAIIVEKLK